MSAFASGQVWLNMLSYLQNARVNVVTKAMTGGVKQKATLKWPCSSQETTLWKNQRVSKCLESNGSNRPARALRGWKLVFDLFHLFGDAAFRQFQRHGCDIWSRTVQHKVARFVHHTLQWFKYALNKNWTLLHQHNLCSITLFYKTLWTWLSHETK